MTATEPVPLTEAEAKKLGRVIVVWYDDTPLVAMVSARDYGRFKDDGSFHRPDLVAWANGCCHHFGERNGKGWYRFEDYPALAARYVDAERKRGRCTSAQETA